MIFKQLAMENGAKIVHIQVFVAINIPCKFGEIFFINE